MNNDIEVTLKAQHYTRRNSCSPGVACDVKLVQRPGSYGMSFLFGKEEYFLDTEQVLGAIDFLLCQQVTGSIRQQNLQRKLNDALRENDLLKKQLARKEVRDHSY